MAFSGWTKSCTTKDADYPITYIGACLGFLNHQQYHQIPKMYSSDNLSLLAWEKNSITSEACANLCSHSLKHMLDVTCPLLVNND